MQAQTVRILYAVLSGIVQFLQQPCIREFQHLPIALIEPKQKIPINVEPFYWRFRLLYGGCNKSQIFINRDLKCIISKSSTVHISRSFYLKALLSLQEKKNSWLFGWGSFLKFSETEKKTKRQLSSDDAIKVLRENMRLRNYAISTEKTYISWVRKLFCFCNNNGMSFTQLQLCGPKLVKDFLAHLAIKRNVSASTQNQAFSSLLMFFRLVFHQELET